VAELFQALEVVFDQMPPLVHLHIVGNERLSVGLRRDDGKRAMLVQLGTYGVVIECLVGDERFEVDVCNQRHDTDAVVTFGQEEERSGPDCPAHRRAPQPWWSGRRAICRWPDCESPFCAAAVPADLDDCAVDECVFLIWFVR
jgi:hypothetical protein